MQRNAKASIAVLLLAIAALAITISFLFMKSASPLGTYIGVTILCEQTDDPIVGLPVTVSYPDGTVVATIPTDSEGFAGWFGSGVPDGPYVITYTWGQTITHEVTK